MYSANPSVESLKSAPSKMYKSSQVNPNLSTNNLASLAHGHNNGFYHLNSQSTTSLNPSGASNTSVSSYFNGSRKNLFEPSPKLAYPITPPLSSSSTPTRDGEFSTPSIFSLNEDSVLTPTTRYGWLNAAIRFLPPIDIKVTVLCFCWYFTSVVSSYSTKIILMRFSYPVTLTQCQFILNSVLAVALFVVLQHRPALAANFPAGTFPSAREVSSVYKFITPSKFTLDTTLPMGVFQFIGHLTSHKATSIIPVSLNHTIKALSPITTVLIYRLLFNTKYKAITYITLLPLVSGIMLSCYKANHRSSSQGHNTGIFYSFVSMMIFVSQNIFAKNRLTVSQDKLPGNMKREKKLDKLTIVFFCSMIGFMFTMPFYIYAEVVNTSISIFNIPFDVGALIILNGFSHFAQSLFAFQILGLISPINYSIASIFKRIFIIVVAFLIEGKPLTGTQIVGIVLTIAGLFAYDKWGSSKTVSKSS